MNKLKKHFVVIILLFLTLIVLTNQKVCASTTADIVQNDEYSDEFKKWLKLSDEEKKKVMQPRMYDIIVTNITSKNPLYQTRMLGATINSRYSLKDVIPSNVAIRNQQQTY